MSDASWSFLDDPGTVAELVTELGKQAVGDAKLEKRIAGLAQEMQRRPELEADAKFIAHVAEVVRHLERGGVTISMKQELRDLVAPEAPASEPTSTAQTRATTRQATQQPPAAAAGQAATQPQTQTRAAAFGSAMTQLYAALRPPQPTTPPSWEQAPQPLGSKLEAFERRRVENVTANQIQAAQQAGERAQASLERLGTGPGSAILNQIKEAAQSEPGGMVAVVAQMTPGGKFAGVRAAFNAGMVQERGFASAYDGAVRDITSYGEARLKLHDGYGSRQMDVSAVNGQFEGLDRAIGQASEAIPGRKDGKSVQDEIAEKAMQVAAFLKDVVQRIGNAVRPVQAPSETPKPAASPAMAPAMTP